MKTLSMLALPAVLFVGCSAKSDESRVSAPPGNEARGGVATPGGALSGNAAVAENSNPDGPLWVVLSNFNVKRNAMGVNQIVTVDYRIVSGRAAGRYVLRVTTKRLAGLKEIIDFDVSMMKQQGTFTGSVFGFVDNGASVVLGLKKRSGQFGYDDFESCSGQLTLGQAGSSAQGFNQSAPVAKSDKPTDAKPQTSVTDQSVDEDAAIVLIEYLGGRFSVSGLPPYRVSSVNLANTEVTDAEVADLTKALPMLHILTLGFTKITDSGLVHLSRLTELRFLSLHYLKITDAALLHVKDLTRLTSLHLTDTNVTDAGLIHLKRLTELKTLDLSSTQVTDAGLVHLKGLTKLKTLQLSKTKVTETGVKKLQAALPKCKITI